jgi:hypothetical protein
LRSTRNPSCGTAPRSARALSSSTTRQIAAIHAGQRDIGQDHVEQGSGIGRAHNFAQRIPAIGGFDDADAQIRQHRRDLTPLAGICDDDQRPRAFQRTARTACRRNPSRQAAGRRLHRGLARTTQQDHLPCNDTANDSANRTPMTSLNRGLTSELSPSARRRDDYRVHDFTWVRKAF